MAEAAVGALLFLKDKEVAKSIDAFGKASLGDSSP